VLDNDCNRTPTAADVATPMPIGCKVSNLQVQLSGTVTTPGGVWDFTVLKNGIPTLVSCDVGTPAPTNGSEPGQLSGSCSDTVDTALFAAGDLFVIAVTPEIPNLLPSDTLWVTGWSASCAQ